MKLEYVDSLTLAHPFIKGFDQTCHCISDEEVRGVAQGDISDTVLKRKPENIEGNEGACIVYSTTFYIGLAIERKPPGATGQRKLDISYPTTEFTKLVKQWEKFDEATMGIIVRHIKSSGLPDNVFDAGERPAKLAQKRVKGPEKSSNTSPDMPNKRQRSSQSMSDIPLRNAENGIPGITSSLQPVAETLDDIPFPKDDMKPSQPPFGENVAVTTAAR